MNREAELESQVRQLEQRNAATAEELRCSRDREKALREHVAQLEAEVDRLQGVALDERREAQTCRDEADASEARVAALEGALREAADEVSAMWAAFDRNDNRRMAVHAIVNRMREALAAAVPQPPRETAATLTDLQGLPLDDDDDTCGVQSSLRCVREPGHRGAHAFGVSEGPAVPQPPPKQLVDEQFNDKFFDEMVRQGSPDPRRRISNVTKVYPMGQDDEGPAVPQGDLSKSKVDAFRSAILKALEEFDGE